MCGYCAVQGHCFSPLITFSLGFFLNSPSSFFTAVSLSLSKIWRYLSVIRVVLWPSNSATVFLAFSLLEQMSRKGVTESVGRDGTFDSGLLQGCSELLADIVIAFTGPRFGMLIPDRPIRSVAWMSSPLSPPEKRSSAGIPTLVRSPTPPSCAHLDLTRDGSEGVVAPFCRGGRHHQVGC